MKVKGRALSYVPVSGATMKNELVATVTEGGAVLLPEEIRMRLDLTVGAKLLLEVVTGGEAVILRRKGLPADAIPSESAAEDEPAATEQARPKKLDEFFGALKDFQRGLPEPPELGPGPHTFRDDIDDDMRADVAHLKATIPEIAAFPDFIVAAVCTAFSEARYAAGWMALGRGEGAGDSFQQWLFTTACDW